MSKPRQPQAKGLEGSTAMKGLSWSGGWKKKKEPNRRRERSPFQTRGRAASVRGEEGSQNNRIPPDILRKPSNGGSQEKKRAHIRTGSLVGGRKQSAVLSRRWLVVGDTGGETRPLPSKTLQNHDTSQLSYGAKKDKEKGGVSGRGGQKGRLRKNTEFQKLPEGTNNGGGILVKIGRGGARGSELSYRLETEN